ncbi:bifunctional adenosylcobinamide kinase/adenosylcobinamide-phosphate guanylyltransferase [Vibrio kagoshimensis]|uniref:bifunctional adenosylcobinamide kinase/adenosylcobinamide-phosphate guanylyltransferase n=1 Tax=Vibrio kagoshimensis TaxID=2910244 RepID=UPI003D19A2BD
MNNHHLILGGARSGKSGFAEQQAIELANSSNDLRLNYVATAICFDEEMKERIAHHQQRRNERWIEHEESSALDTLFSGFDHNDIVLVDCLTLWLNNVIYNLGEEATNEQVELEIERLVSSVNQSNAQFIMVSNEVGLGIVPMGKVSRLFVDNAGRMNQALARVVANVTFIAAGLPMKLKS